MNTKPLSKDFYSFIIFFLCIQCIVSLVQAFALLRMGPMITGLSSFDSWMWLVLAVIGITNAAFVRYLLHHGYRLAGIFCVVSCITVFVQYVPILIRSLRMFYFENHHIIASVIFGTALVLGLSLAWIKPAGNRWLRWCGMLTIVLSLSAATVYYLYFQTGEGGTKLMLDKINRWISLAGVLSPVFILMHFYEESKRLSVSDYAPARTFPALLKLAAFIGMLFFGFNFSVETYARSQPYQPSVTEMRRSKLVESHHSVDKSGDSLHYRLLKPIDYDSTKRYPLIVCLHHGGSHGKDNIQQLSADPAPFLMENGNRTKYTPNTNLQVTESGIM